MIWKDENAFQIILAQLESGAQLVDILGSCVPLIASSLKQLYVSFAPIKALITRASSA